MKDYTNSLNQSHFVSPVSSPERERASKGVIPANTRANSNWTVKFFKEWACNCSAMTPKDPVPSNLLECQPLSGSWTSVQVVMGYANMSWRLGGLTDHNIHLQH